MPKAFSEREKELITQRLLEQGYRLFSSYGLKKTNVEEIAQAAGISKGAFYNFYDSKETLFMSVVEQVETQLRQQILAVVDLPGPTPRARLKRVLQETFSLLKSMPILRYLTGGDYDLILRRLPPERFQAHLSGDQAFLETLIARGQQAGIPIRASTVQIMSLLYPILLGVLHANDWGANSLGNGLDDSLDLLLELIAAFCLGEVQIEPV